MTRLAGKIAVITGGNSGIGEATAKLFAREGATVVITARREKELQRVADEIAAEGGACVYIPGDVTVTADVDNVMAKTVELFGRIDILVNNAGIGDRHTPTIKVEDDFWDRSRMWTSRASCAAAEQPIGIWCLPTKAPL